MYKSIVKKMYDKGIYSADDVAVFVKSGKITTDDYEDITGKEYAEV